MLTDLEISNLALGHLGCERIASLADDNNRAKLCNDFLNISRKHTLELGHWDFAIKRATLTSNATPAFEWTYQYDLPDDLIHIISEYEEAEYKIEGAYILSDSPTLKLKYIYEIDEDVKRSATFDSTWSLLLAHYMSYSLTQNLGLKDRLLNDAETMAAKSMSRNSARSTPDSYEFDVFTTSRL